MNKLNKLTIIFLCLVTMFSSTSFTTRLNDNLICGAPIAAENINYVADPNFYQVHMKDLSTGITTVYTVTLTSGEESFLQQTPGIYDIDVIYYTEHPTDFGYLSLKRISDDTVIDCRPCSYGTQTISFSKVKLSCGNSYKIIAHSDPC